MFKMIRKLFCKKKDDEPKTIGDLIKMQVEVRNGHIQAAGEVIQWLDAGKKVNAIKAIRMATGAGIKEAKALVDRGINHSFSEVKWIEEIACIRQ